MKKGREDIFRRIRRVLQFVWESPYSSFYRDKYNKLGINLIKDSNSLEDFQKLPFLTKEEITGSSPYERFFLPLEKLSSIGISSGTTRDPGSLSVVFKARTSEVTNKSIWESNARSSMLLLPPLRSAQIILADLKIKPYSQMIKVAGDVANLLLSAKVATSLKIDALFASPTVLYFFTPYLNKEYDLNYIKYIKLGGEYCSVQKALFFKKHFKQAQIVCSYGLSENDGFVGLYCPFLDPLLTGYFHPNPESYYESVGVAEGKELVLTNLLKNMFPLIRYKTGDEIEMEDFKCKCGQGRRFRILGRINYDTARVHGTFIYSHLMEKVLRSFNLYLESPWQLHVYENMVRDKIMPKLKLQVILKTNYKSKARLIRATMEKGVSEELYLSAKKTLADLVKEGVFLPLEVEFVESFPQSTKHRYIVPHLD